MVESYYNVIVDQTHQFVEGSEESDLSECLYPSGQKGDINSDCIVDILDVILIVNNVLDGNYTFHSDLNQDHLLNIQDIILLIGNILES